KYVRVQAPAFPEHLTLRHFDKLFVSFSAGRIDSEIPDVATDAFAGRLDEGVFAGFEALVDGVAEHAARRRPGLKFDVDGLMFLFAREVDTDIIEHPLAVFNLRPEQPEAGLP